MSRPPSLSVVADNDLRTAKSADSSPPETPAAKVRRLTAEAKTMARDHVQSFAELLAEVQAMAAEIEDGGDAYSAGSRQIAREAGADCGRHAMNLAAILGRGA